VKRSPGKNFTAIARARDDTRSRSMNSTLAINGVSPKHWVWDGMSQSLRSCEPQNRVIFGMMNHLVFGVPQL